MYYLCFRNQLKQNTMGTLFYLVCLGIGSGIGYLIAESNKPKCNHKWKRIHSNEILNNRNQHIGWLKVYECEHCLKMKKIRKKLL